MKHAACLLAFALSAYAGAIGERSSSAKCVSYTDTYDDLPSNPALPELEPVGTYHGLLYTAFGTSVYSSPTSGVKPESGSNVATASMVGDLLAVGDVTLSVFGSIAATGKTADFSLVSFYFGCKTPAGTSLAGTATGCTISVTGFDDEHEQVSTVAFSFAPEVSEGAPLVLAVLPSAYSHMKNVTIGVANDEAVTSETALVIDNLVHCNYKN